MREEGWGQPPKVFSAWWGASQPSLAAHRSQLQEPGGAPASWTWGRGDVGTWGLGLTTLPSPSPPPTGMVGVRPPHCCPVPSPHQMNWIISTSSLKLILDFPSLGGENEAKS